MPARGGVEIDVSFLLLVYLFPFEMLFGPVGVEINREGCRFSAMKVDMDFSVGGRNKLRDSPESMDLEARVGFAHEGRSLLTVCTQTFASPSMYMRQYPL
jgi:hypothetical protein